MAKTIAQYYAEGVEYPFTQQGLDQMAEEEAEKAIRQQRTERSPRTVADFVATGSDTPFIDQAKSEMAAEAAQKAKIKQLEDAAQEASSAKTVKMPTRPGQQPMVTMDMVKAAGFDNLRDYMNAQQGLVRRKEVPVVYKEMSLANSLKSKPKYAKGGKINLDACGVSTHTPSKKNANW